jgi:hypothetical protein
VALADERVPLGVEVAEEGPAGRARDKGRGERLKLVAEPAAHEQPLGRHE